MKPSTMKEHADRFSDLKEAHLSNHCTIVDGDKDEDTPLSKCGKNVVEDIEEAIENKPIKDKGIKALQSIKDNRPGKWPPFVNEAEKICNVINRRYVTERVLKILEKFRSTWTPLPPRPVGRPPKDKSQAAKSDTDTDKKRNRTDTDAKPDTGKKAKVSQAAKSDTDTDKKRNRTDTDAKPDTGKKAKVSKLDVIANNADVIAAQAQADAALANLETAKKTAHLAMLQAQVTALQAQLPAPILATSATK
jgi:hypothetical protein